MSPIALAKIPLLLLATAGLHIAVTPPQPPPDETEKAAASRVVRLEAMLKTRSVPATVKTLVWIACICEILAILAATIPQLDASSNLVSLLSVTGSPARQCTSGIDISLTFVVCGLMAAVGGFIRWCCYRALGRMFTFEMSIRQDHRLVTNGPYAYARHPGYTAILLTVTGIAGMHATEGSWIRQCGVAGTPEGLLAVATYLTLVSVVTVGLLRRMSAEDETLKKEFGSEWDEWAVRVPWKLVPHVY